MKILPAALLASLAAFPAMARQDPSPKPSGIVIHLFGSDSGSSSQPSPSTPSAATNDKAPQGGEAQSGEATQNTQAPTIGQVLHQMFVTGDPAQDSKPHFAQGRNGSF